MVIQSGLHSPEVKAALGLPAPRRPDQPSLERILLTLGEPMLTVEKAHPDLRRQALRPREAAWTVPCPVNRPTASLACPH